MQDLTVEFSSNLQSFEKLLKVSQEIQTPNSEDDEFIKAAIVGFSKYAPTEQWTRDHYVFIKKYRDSDYSDESLACFHGRQARKMALFVCLCLGTLLGMFQSEKITEDEFVIAEAQLPGYLMLYADRF